MPLVSHYANKETSKKPNSHQEELCTQSFFLSFCCHLHDSISFFCRNKNVPIRLPESWSTHTHKHKQERVCVCVCEPPTCEKTRRNRCVLPAFERSFTSRRFSSLSVVQWACCHQINETLWAAVPEKHTHTHFHHIVARRVCISVVLLWCALIKLWLWEDENNT